MNRVKRGFTLVELLVVIGIIALLISILLPSLNRARQQANLISCQSRLHQIGAAMEIYESENKGVLPHGSITNANFNGTSLGNPSFNSNHVFTEYTWWWMYALGDLMNPNMLAQNGQVTHLSKVFQDVDTIDGMNLPTAISHYTSNPRVFYTDQAAVATRPVGVNNVDPVDCLGVDLAANRRASDIKNSSNVFAIWDAPQDGDQQYNAYGICCDMDKQAVYSNGLVLNGSVGTTPIQPNLAVIPGASGMAGTAGITDGSLLQKKFNYDPPSAYSFNPVGLTFRFRHMINTKLNALCVDGHVETRAVGTVLRRDIYTNAPGSSY